MRDFWTKAKFTALVHAPLAKKLRKSMKIHLLYISYVCEKFVGCIFLSRCVLHGRTPANFERFDFSFIDGPIVFLHYWWFFDILERFSLSRDLHLCSKSTREIDIFRLLLPISRQLWKGKKIISKFSKNSVPRAQNYWNSTRTRL